MTDLNRIATALFHDIGHILVRAGENPAEHAECGAMFLRPFFPESLGDAVRSHHMGQSLLAKADAIATEADVCDEDQWNSLEPLQCIFDTLSTDSERRGYSVSSQGSVEPEPWRLQSQEAYRAIATALKAEISQIHTYQQPVNALLLIARRYMNRVPLPVDKQTHRDVSLYQHGRITTAILECLTGTTDAQPLSCFFHGPVRYPGFSYTLHQKVLSKHCGRARSIYPC